MNVHLCLMPLCDVVRRFSPALLIGAVSLGAVADSSDTLCGPRKHFAVPVYFGPRSFCDPDVEARSILDCRDTLMHIYDAQAKAAVHGGEAAVKDSGLWDTLMTLRSIFFNPCLDYYALYAQEGQTPTWRRTTLDVRLLFTAEEYCEGPVVMLKLTLAQADSSATPVLFAGLPTVTASGVRLQPRGHFPPRQRSRIVHPRKPTDENPAGREIITTFAVPNDEPRIMELVRHDGVGYVEYHQDTLTAWSRLRAVMHEGDTVDILQDRMFGHHSLYDAYIGDPLMVDVNGDGLYDIVVESSAGSRVLGVQLPYGGIELRYIRNRDMTGSGGC